VKDTVLVIAPAVFGLVGTVLGGWLAQRSAASERQVREDNDARKALADLLNLFLPASGCYTVGQSGEARFVTLSQTPRRWVIAFERLRSHSWLQESLGEP
jgi:hypothetical protein